MATMFLTSGEWSTSIQTRRWSMLVLTRKPGELIRIGKDITIAVVRISGDVVRLGIEAPRDVTVVRTELEGPDQERNGDGD
jgi:carbon storage regulator CsrA